LIVGAINSGSGPLPDTISDTNALAANAGKSPLRRDRRLRRGYSDR
jgi:hypothetical protein